MSEDTCRTAHVYSFVLGQVVHSQRGGLFMSITMFMSMCIFIIISAVMIQTFSMPVPDSPISEPVRPIPTQL